MTFSRAVLVAAVGLPCAMAHGAIFFTFQDPGPSREVSVAQNQDDSMTFTYSFDDTVSLFFTSDMGEIPNTTFGETRLTMNLTTSTTPLVDQPGLLVAEISGEFVFEDVSGDDPIIIMNGLFNEAVATLLMGQFMGKIEASGSATGDSVVGSLELFAGDALLDILAPGESLGGRMTSSFAFSELSGTPDGDGLLKMTGSAAFTGSSEIIPAPGALGLLGLGGMAISRRRRATAA